jgi:hypothetical protein
MKLASAKKDSELSLQGITFETEYHDSTLKSVTMRDGNGGIVRIAQGEYSGIKALVPAQPTMVKRHKVSGTVAGLPVSQMFETEYDAARAKHHYERKLAEHDDAKLTIEVVEVPEDEVEPSPEIPF